MALAEKIPQGVLRNPKKHNNEKPFAYVATCNQNNPELFTEMMKNLEDIENKDKIKEMLDTTKIIKSQRQSKNLKRILTSSTFEKKNTTQGVTKWKNKRCKICNIIIEGKSYTFKNPETKFKIDKNLSCSSKNVVYKIECNVCKEIYIGSTQALNTRTSLHGSNIKIEENRKSNLAVENLILCQSIKTTTTHLFK